MSEYYDYFSYYYYYYYDPKPLLHEEWRIIEVVDDYYSRERQE